MRTLNAFVCSSKSAPNFSSVLASFSFVATSLVSLIFDFGRCLDGSEKVPWEQIFEAHNVNNNINNVHDDGLTGT